MSNADPAPRIRILEMKVMRGRDISPHANNPYIHPTYARETLVGSVDQDGITDVLRAYYSERNGGSLTFLNGHMRAEEYPDAYWPVVILDLNDEEADRQLLVGDTIASWRQSDPLKIGDLVARANAMNAGLEKAVERIRENVAPQLEIAKQLLDDATSGRPKPRNRYDDVGKNAGQAVKIVLIIEDQLPVVEQALRATGLQSRGEALVKLCQYYLDNNPNESGQR